MSSNKKLKTVKGVVLENQKRVDGSIYYSVLLLGDSEKVVKVTKGDMFCRRVGSEIELAVTYTSLFGKKLFKRYWAL